MKGSYSAGDLVNDKREENDLQLVVYQKSGRAGEVLIDDFETVAEYTECDQKEPVYECLEVTGWTGMDEKCRDERLDMVRRFDCTKYYYPASLLVSADNEGGRE